MFHFYCNFFYHKPLPLFPTLPKTFSVPKRITGKSFERPVKILGGIQIFGENLAGAAEAAAVWTVWF